MNIKRIFLIITLLITSWQLSAQALRGTTGLLHMPTGDMEQDKTFKFGGNLLHLTPLRYIGGNGEIKYTFNYYINITFFPWLEVGYTCTLNYAEHGSTYFPSSVWGKYSNQDRSFYGRIRIWKEGWWKSWTPQIVLGADDPGTHQTAGGGSIGLRDENDGNAFFMKYYLAATKHVKFNHVGELGTHLAYVIDSPAWAKEVRGMAVGANFRFQAPSDCFFNKFINGFNIMAEYDARTVNVGGSYSFWKEHINLIAELNDGQYFSGGVQFKVHL
jgi:hypothetical protein